MSEDRIDFSPLDPTRDPERFDGIVRSITAEAERELARRRARTSVVGQLGLWWKPLLAAAAVAGIVALGALARYGSPATTVEAEIGIAEAIGMPEQVAIWVRSDEAPSPAELLVELED